MAEYKDPREEDIVYEDRRISRPDASVPDWYVSDASYRPIPIAWFAAAVLIQTGVISALFFALLWTNGWATIVLATLASGGIFYWTWQRGIGRSGAAWQVATVVAMLVQLGFIILAVSTRM